MRRLLLTVSAKRCAFGCTYCFAGFSQYEAPPSLEQVERGEIDLTGVDVVYPACDVDLFAMRHRWADVVQRSMRLDRSISISTKAPLSARQAEALGVWSDELRSRGRVLKVGVSASTMSRCEELEPRAASWDERTENLRRLGDLGVPTALTLKPLLPEIPASEYVAMIDEVAPYTPAVVLGDEYVDDEARLRRPTRGGAVDGLASREVEWLAGAPRWLVREASERIAVLGEHARRRGLAAYASDLDLMDDLAAVAVA